MLYNYEKGEKAKNIEERIAYEKREEKEREKKDSDASPNGSCHKKKKKRIKRRKT